MGLPHHSFSHNIHNSPQYKQQMKSYHQAMQLANQGAQNGTGSTSPPIHSSAAGIPYQPGSGAILTSNGTWIDPNGNPFYPARKPLENTGIKVGEIIAWRMWQIKGNYLESYSAGHIYGPDEPMEGDPEDYNDAGIWAFKKKKDAIKKLLQSGGAYGSVKMWGKIIEHEIGYRSEFAKIISIDDVHLSQIDKKLRKQVLENLRETYGLK